MSVSAIVSAIVTAVVLSQSVPGSPSAFTDRMDYYARDGGKWTSTNGNFKPGSGQPRSYEYEWEWGLDRRLARLRILGVSEQGERHTFWEATVAWHPTTHVAVMRQVGATGAVADGVVSWPTTSSTEVRLTFAMPSGEIWAFLELDTVLGPNEFRSESYRLRDGKWVLQSTSVWRRLKDRGSK